MDDTSCDRVNISPDCEQYHLLLPAAMPVDHDLDDLIKDGKKMRTGMMLHKNQLPSYHHDKKHTDQSEDLLCAGERIDNMFDTQHSATKYSERPIEEEHGNNTSETNICLEKRRQFSLMRSAGSSPFHSFDSSNSDPSSHSRHSVTSFLQARQCDAEDILFSLGLGGDSRMTIPERFLVNSSSAKGSIGDVNPNPNPEEEDIFDASSMSYSSTWSDLSQFFERIPTRFISSTSSFGSNTDISEPEESDIQNLTLPVIIEPEQKDENSFDLMRHLRLNPSKEHLVHGDRILLEPVKEELEVSSVGSGSARTKISNTQQDSLDSLGNTSVLTKISRKQESEERTVIESLPTSYEEKALEDGQHAPTAETVNSLEGDKNGEGRYDNNVRFVSVDKANKDLPSNTGDNESGISSLGESVLNLNVLGALKPPVLGVLALRTPHDSFELEEIATSNENLDKIEDIKSRGKYIKAKSTRSLKRENSDESSGFEDDTQVKKQSSESLVVNDEKTSLIENNSDSDVNINRENSQTHLLLFDSSTPETAGNRRSAFAKRNAWSTTKQKRVVFQDEPRERSRSFDVQSSLAYKLDTRRYSLDVPLSRVTEPQKDFLAETLIPYNSDTNKDRKNPEKTAVNNIKRFLSSLMSIRNKFRKTEQEKGILITDHVPVLVNLPNTDSATSSVSTGIPSIISVQTSDSNHVSLVSGSPLGKGSAATRDERNDVECLVESGAIENSCIEELDLFEEDLKKYRAAFLASEATSTAQESYYTKKLLARFAWDIVTIRKLRSLIKDELSTMQSCLRDRRLYVSKFSNISLPPGIVDQMKCLLSLQSSLQTYLFDFAEHVPQFRWKTTERSTEDIANEMKRSIFQELKQMFNEQIDSLRKELQEKDTVINELLTTVEQIKNNAKNPKQEH